MTADEGGTDPLFAGVGDIVEEAARHTLTDGAAVAVLTRQARTRELVYATDPLAARLDELQYTLGEGPCLDAYLDDTPQFHPDLESDTRTSRWPTFATEVSQLGVHSLFAFPIPGPRRPLGPSGVLELYRRTAGEITQTQYAAAAGAATAIAQRLQSNWAEYRTRFSSPDEAIDAAVTSAARHPLADAFTRSQIHVAAGMLAYQLGIHPDHAVDRLRAHAYAAGRRVSSLAADIIAHRLILHDQPAHPNDDCP